MGKLILKDTSICLYIKIYIYIIEHESNIFLLSFGLNLHNTLILLLKSIAGILKVPLLKVKVALLTVYVCEDFFKNLF